MTALDPVLPEEIRRRLRALEAEVIALRAENARLQQENATLREQLTAAQRAVKRPAAPFARRARKGDPQKPEARLDALADEGRKFSDPDNARRAARLRFQREHGLRFLFIGDLDATNNLAKRQLWPNLVTRKPGAVTTRTRGETPPRSWAASWRRAGSKRWGSWII